eukprot:jgi/Chlat1/2958/Chrsp2S04689
MVQLTEKMVLAKTRAECLDHVRNLNLWGNNIDDVSVLERMPNVQVLSLSVNKISSLQDFSQCHKLQELYLRKNEVSRLEEVRWLAGLPALRVLWLCDNACAESPHYRAAIIRAIPTLQKLDHNVTDEERAECASVQLPPELDFASALSAVASEQQRVGSGARAAPSAAAEEPVPAGLERRSSTSRQSAPPVEPFTQLSVANHAPRPQNKASPTPAQASSNVLYAVMALLNELDEDGLQIVKTEVDQRLGL